MGFGQMLLISIISKEQFSYLPKRDAFPSQYIKNIYARHWFVKHMTMPSNMRLYPYLSD